MSATLSNVIKRENNNFDLVRLIAATSVIFGHSFELFPTNGHYEPLKKVLLYDYSGSLAVYIFFFLSGIFITASYNGSKTFFRFLMMRIFRIYPAILVCTIVTVFIVGPAFTTLNLSDYFKQTDTWTYLTTNLFMIHFQPLLKSVLDTNRWKYSLNGSLWTLPIEIRCYLLVLLFGCLGLLKKKISVLIVLVLILAFSKSGMLLRILQVSEMRQVVFFMFGVFAYSFREYFIIDLKVAVIMIFACVIAKFINFKVFIGLFYVSLIYSMLVLATSKLFRKIKLPGDYSYGIYIYGFLIQQILAHLFPTLTSYPSMIVSIPIVIVCGITSWHLVELPAINFGKRISDKYKMLSFLYNKDFALKKPSTF